MNRIYIRQDVYAKMHANTFWRQDVYAKMHIFIHILYYYTHMNAQYNTASGAREQSVGENVSCRTYE